MHSKIPQQYMKTVIAPIYKNKKGDKIDARKYRLFSLTTTITELIGNYNYPDVFTICFRNWQQFGFKPQHGKDMFVFF